MQHVMVQDDFLHVFIVWSTVGSLNVSQGMPAKYLCVYVSINN